MSGLSALNLLYSKPVPKSKIREIRRQKLCRKVTEQLEMAQCVKQGRAYEVMVSKTTHDAETAEVRQIKQPKRIKPWWWFAENGMICLTVRYGAKPLELMAGCNAIETDSIDGVIASLEIVRAATEAGELDAQIEGLITKKKNFEKTGRPTLTLKKAL